MTTAVSAALHPKRSRAAPAGQRGHRAHLVAAALEIVLAVAALGGAATMIADPSGGLLGLPLRMLASTPFSSWRVPAFALLAANAALPLAAALSALRRATWASEAHLVAGAATMAWIVTQRAAFADRIPAVQGGVFATGAAIFALGLAALAFEHRARGASLAPAVASRLTATLVVVGAITANGTVFAPDVLRDPAAFAASARGTALVLLVAVLPALVASSRAAAHGSARGVLVWAGSLAFIAADAARFGFVLHGNVLLLVAIAMLALAVSALASLVVADRAVVAARFDEPVPVRAIAGWLVALAVLLTSLRLVEIVAALAAAFASPASGGLPAGAPPALDLAFVVPALLATSWGLVRVRPWAAPAAGAVLSMLVAVAAGLAVERWFVFAADPRAPGPSTAAVLAFVALTGAGLVPLVALLRRVRSVAAAPRSA